MTDATSRITVGHLLMENSRVIKFPFESDARVFAILTSANYCVSPLVQARLEISCQIEIHNPPRKKNK